MGTEYKKVLGTVQTSQAGLGSVAFRGSKLKWFFKFINKPSFHTDGGIWTRLTRTIFKGGQYTETVIDPTTKKVLHHQSHPLPEHKGHGSDKPSEHKKRRKIRGTRKGGDFGS